MKNKKFTYLLIILVIAIWSTIIFKIIRHFRKIDGNNNQFLLDTTRARQTTTIDPIYQLKLTYKDPFLKGQHTVYRESNVSSIINHGKNRNQQILYNQQIVWPEIIFTGTVINDKTGGKLGLFQIGPDALILKPGEEKSGVTLIELHSDSVTLSFQKTKKTFYKNR